MKLSNTLFALGIFATFAQAQTPTASSQVAGNGNPFIPGYFADPTIKKFGDTYYVYATTDNVKEASGEPQVWMSKDLVNWHNYEMTVPRNTDNVWAPDITVGPDGRYYYYYASCQNGCSIYGYVSTSPTGPWTSLNTNNTPVINPDFSPPVIPLDAHVFKDDDGSYWVYHCTWAGGAGNGVGWAKLNSDMRTFSAKGIIPNSQLPNVFEAPFMLKRNGKYYMMFSIGDCHDATYRVGYSIGNSPNGTFTPGANSPILQTNSDGSVHGPGHHSMLQEGNDHYIVYHRHDNPHSTGGLLRQLCMDKMNFDSNGNILKITPTHTGVGMLGNTNQVPQTDLAYKKTATASSYYTDVVNNYSYTPALAVDQNNGTLWRAGNTNMGEWFQVDLGNAQTVKRVMTYFEFATFYYQYKIEYSTNGTSWSMYADRTVNKRAAGPYLDDNNVTARYLRITFTGVEKPGHFAAIWNMKVYGEASTLFVPMANQNVTEGPYNITRGNKLIDLDIASLATGNLSVNVNNLGTMGGNFNRNNTPITVGTVAGRKALTFNGASYLRFNQNAPNNLAWNSPFTVSSWVHNPTIEESETIVAWARRGGPNHTYAGLYYGFNTTYGAVGHWAYADMGYAGGAPSANAWHHISVTFDGLVEKLYVNGKLNRQQQKNLYVHANSPIYVGWSTQNGGNTEYLTGSIASLKMYDYALSAQDITTLFNGNEVIVTGFEEEMAVAQSWHVFPNPATSELNVQTDGTAEQISLLNLKGETIRSITNPAEHEKIDLSTLAKGMYFVKISGSQSKVQKVIVE
jgi:xylan 1,4-beta-xylosidase